jgi:hypothetical protein
MKTNLTLLFLIIFLSTAAAQTNYEVAKTPRLNYDWLPGFSSITEVIAAPGLSLTDEPYAKYYYGITTMAGYQFTRNIKAGAGVGVQFHNEGTLFPLFIDARYSFSAQEFVPFIAAAGGMALSFENLDNQSFLFINPSLGVRWVAAIRMNVSLSSGLMIMSAAGGRDSFINFKLGLEFKGK